MIVTRLDQTVGEKGSARRSTPRPPRFSRRWRKEQGAEILARIPRE